MTENTTENRIETGIETQDFENPETDVKGFADDGEHATTWEVRRLNTTVVAVSYYRHEAGLCDADGEETFEIDADTPTREFARELANADPEEAVRIARETFEN